MSISFMKLSAVMLVGILSLMALKLFFLHWMAVDVSY